MDTKIEDIHHQTSEPNILGRKRNTTDRTILVIFSILIIFWISIVIYAYLVGDVTQIFIPDFMTRSKKFFNVSRIFIIIGYILLAVLYSTLLFTAMRWFSNFSYITLVTFWILPVIIIALTVYYTHFVTVVASIAAIFSCILTCVIINTEWLHLPEKILKESCKAIIFFPTAVLFSVTCCSTCLLVIVTALTVHLNLQTIKEEDNKSTPAYIVFFEIVNAVVGGWLFVFVFNLCAVVLSGAFAMWFYTEDKTEMTSNIIFRCLKFTVRYHLGTIAHASSIFGPGKIHRMMFLHVVKKFKAGSVNFRFICFAIANIFDAVVLRFTLSCAMVMCATEGYGYFEAAKESFDYFLRHSKKCLTVTKIIDCVIISTLIIISLLMFMSVYGYLDYLPVQNNEDYNWKVVFGSVIVLGSLIFVLSLIALLSSAYSTILFCFLKDLEEHDACEKKPYIMSPELRSILITNGPPSWYQKGLIKCRFMVNMNTYSVSQASERYESKINKF